MGARGQWLQRLDLALETELGPEHHVIAAVVGKRLVVGRASRSGKNVLASIAAPSVLAARQRVLDTAYAAHPERFVHGAPKAPTLPTAVWINPPKDKERSELTLH